MTAYKNINTRYFTTGAIYSNAFIPRNIQNCMLWIRGDIGITKDGSNNVSAWADKSGNATDVGFAQATGANQPLYVSNSINGFPSIRFNGSSSKMTCNGAFSAVIKSDGTAGTLFFAVKVISIAKDVGSGNQYQNDTLFADSGADWGMTFRQTGPTMNAYTWASSYAFTPDITITTGTTCVLMWRRNSTTLFANKNRAADVSVAKGASGSMSNPMMLGVRGVDTNYGNFDLLEVAGFNVNLSATDEARVQQYLISKYAIT